MRILEPKFENFRNSFSEKDTMRSKRSGNRLTVPEDDLDGRAAIPRAEEATFVSLPRHKRGRLFLSLR